MDGCLEPYLLTPDRCLLQIHCQLSVSLHSDGKDLRLLSLHPTS